jgi:microcystin-dependent protein
MASPYVGEIRVFACNFAPTGWAMCNGQILPISQNTALFSILGTTYGGDGKSNFALPNIQGRATMASGQGPGLTSRNLGEAGGEPSVTLNLQQIPAHTHIPSASLAATTPSPNGAVWANPGGRPAPNAFATPIGTAQIMNAQATAATGGSQPHNNLMPYQTLNFCIALQGVFPPRS